MMLFTMIMILSSVGCTKEGPDDQSNVKTSLAGTTWKNSESSESTFLIKFSEDTFVSTFTDLEYGDVDEGRGHYVYEHPNVTFYMESMDDEVYDDPDITTGKIIGDIMYLDNREEIITLKRQKDNGTTDDGSDDDKEPETPSSTINISDVTASSAVISGNISTGGKTIVEKGFCYSTNSTPDIYDEKVQIEKDQFRHTLENLSPIKKYYIRIYTVDSKDKVEYQETHFFQTNLAINLIENENTTICEDALHLDLYPYTKVCYATHKAPRITDHIIQYPEKNDIGGVSISMYDLNKGTTYYLRGYIEEDDGIVYSENEIAVRTIGGSDINISYKPISQSTSGGSGGVSLRYQVIFECTFRIPAGTTYKVSISHYPGTSYSYISKDFPGASGQFYTDGGSGKFYCKKYSEKLEFGNLFFDVASLKFEDTKTKKTYAFDTPTTSKSLK